MDWVAKLVAHEALGTQLAKNLDLVAQNSARFPETFGFMCNLPLLQEFLLLFQLGTMA